MKYRRWIAGIIVIIFVLIGIVVYMRSTKLTLQYKNTISDSTYMMHALGGLENKYSYTNSYDALTTTYNDGYRLFEADIHFTSDKQLVLSHGWKEKDITERLGLDFSQYDGAMDLDTFKTIKIHGRFTPMTFGELCIFIEQHKDMFVMIDVGNLDYNETLEIYGAMVNNAEQVCTSSNVVLEHFIVGGHTPDMIRAVKEIYPFELYNLYLAKENKRAEEIKTIDAFFEYCRENNISSLSMDKSVFTEEVKDAAAENNMICYVFTVNDLNDLQCDIDRSDIIIGTDFLR